MDIRTVHDPQCGTKYQKYIILSRRSGWKRIATLALDQHLH